MQFDNQKTRNVADVVARILAGESAQQEPKMLEEELKGNQHMIDANKNKKIDAHDFKLLRAQKDKEKANSMKHGKDVKEEIEELEELSKSTLQSYAGKVIDKTRTMPQGAKKQKHLAGYGSAMDKMDKKMKEEVELTESHFKVGDEVVCKKSGMEGEVVKVDEPQVGKYYTVKQENGKMVKYAPDELKKEEEDEDEDEDKKEMKESAGASKAKEEKFHMGLDKLVHKTFGHSPAEKKEKMKEEVIDEAKKGMWPGTPEYKAKFGTDKEKHEAKYGKSDVKKLAPYGYRDKSEYEKAKEMKEEKSFSAMLESYKEGGLKYIATLVREEPDNEQFTKEVEEQKKRDKGEIRNDKGVAKPLQNASVREDPVNPVREEVEELDELSKSTLGSYVKKRVKQLPAIETNYQMTPDEGGPFGAKRIKKFQKKVNKGIGRAVDRLSKEEVEDIQVINADIANGVQMVDIAERSLTEPEMKKKEEIVKGMKKGMQGFKQRYGDRAKEVMYATATARAKGN